MARRYPPEVREAIWTLLCEGFGTRQVLEKLERGQAGLPAPVTMPRRTLNDTIRRLRQERGEPIRTVNPGDEIAAAQGIRRQLLDVLARQSARLSEISKARGLTARELDACARAAKVTDEIEARLHDPPPRAKPRPQTQGDDQRSFLAELAEREAEAGAAAEAGAEAGAS